MFNYQCIYFQWRRTHINSYATQSSYFSGNLSRNSLRLFQTFPNICATFIKSETEIWDDLKLRVPVGLGRPIPCDLGITNPTLVLIDLTAHLKAHGDTQTRVYETRESVYESFVERHTRLVVFIRRWSVPWELLVTWSPAAAAFTSRMNHKRPPWWSRMTSFRHCRSLVECGETSPSVNGINEFDNDDADTVTDWDCITGGIQCEPEQHSTA